MNALQYNEQQVIEEQPERGFYTLIRGIDSNIRRINNELYESRHENERRLSLLENQVSELRKDNQVLNTEIREMRAEIKGDKNTFTTQINSIEKQIDGINRRIDDMHQSQTKWFTLLGVLVAIVPIAIAVIQSFAK